MKTLTVKYEGELSVELVAALLKEAVHVNMDTSQDLPKTNGKRSNHRVTGMTVQKCIMDHYSPKAAFNKTLAEGWVSKLGYKSQSADSALFTLVKHGFLSMTSRGKYVYESPFKPDQLRADVLTNGK